MLVVNPPEGSVRESVKKLGSHELKIYLILFLLSLITRLTYLWEISATPFFHNAVVDEWIYDHMAGAIIQGLPEQNGIFRSPLYPMFLALCYMLFGHGIATARIIQMVIGSVCTLVLYRFSRCFLEKRAAILGALVYTFYWPAIYFQGELLIISIFCFLLILTIHFYFRSLETGKDRLFLLTGLFLGLSCLARGTALFLYPVLSLYYLKAEFSRRGIRALVFLTIATSCVLLVSGFRNYTRTGEFVLLSSNGAINLYTGNNPEADGLNPILPGLKWDKVIKEPIILGLTGTAGRSRYWIAKSLSFIKEEPGKFLRLYLKKCYAFWNALEVSNNKDIYFMRSLSKFLSLPLFGFGIVGAFAILSLLSLKGRNLHVRVLWLIILFYMLGSAFFFAAARYRMAVVPFLILLASHSFFILYDRLKKRNWAIAWKPMILLVAAFLFINLDPIDMRESIITRPHFQAGQIYLTLDRYEEAILEMKKDLEKYPEDPDILNNLGVAYKKKGDITEARMYYEMALEIGEYSGVRWNLGLLYFENKEYRMARTQWLMALQGDPLNPNIRNNLKRVEGLLSNGG
jgi:4-amino-4-deoxy-L-arabinose transferase-like glycosyltransferase